MLVFMATFTVFVPSLEPRIRRCTLVLGFIPTTALFAYGTHLASVGKRPYDFYATALIAMLFGPMFALFVDLWRTKRRRVHYPKK